MKAIGVSWKDVDILIYGLSRFNLWLTRAIGYDRRNKRFFFSFFFSYRL